MLQLRLQVVRHAAAAVGGFTAAHHITALLCLSLGTEMIPSTADAKQTSDLRRKVALKHKLPTPDYLVEGQLRLAVGQQAAAAVQKAAAHSHSQQEEMLYIAKMRADKLVGKPLTFISISSPGGRTSLLLASGA